MGPQGARLGPQGAKSPREFAGGSERAKQATTEPPSFSAPLFCSPLSNRLSFFPFLFPEEVDLIGGEGSVGPCRGGWPGSWNECLGTERRKEEASGLTMVSILHCREATGISVTGGGDCRLGSAPS